MNLVVTGVCGALLILQIAIIYGMQIIPERAYVQYSNPKYIENATIQVRRNSRNSPYYVKFGAIFKYSWGNNVSIHVETYEYLHNEYKRSFVEMHGPVCNMVEHNVLIHNVALNAAITCPLHTGLHEYNNFSLNIERFPYQMPFTKCLVNLTFDIPKTKEFILVANLYITLK